MPSTATARAKCRSKKCRQCHGTGTHECEECDGTGVGTKKIHALFGMILFDCSYEEVVGDKEKYKKGKGGVFAEIYGGNEKTLQREFGISEARAKKAHEQWARQYRGIGKARERTVRNFCSMKQPTASGRRWSGTNQPNTSRVFWLPPLLHAGEQDFAGRCSSLLESRRRAGRNHPIKVVRESDTDGGRAVVACAPSTVRPSRFKPPTCGPPPTMRFNRPAWAITKAVQRAIWDIQPIWHPRPKARAS